MAYTEEKFFTRGTKFNKDWRISILEDGGAGAGDRITAKEQFFRKRYPFTVDRDFWKQKIIEPVLEVTIRFESSEDLSFYRGIVDSPDDTYRLQFKYDGSVDVFGSISSDLITIDEQADPKTVTLRAKPLLVQRGDKYPLRGATDNVEYAELVGDIVNQTDTDYPLYTYNNWSPPSGGDSEDYFNVAAVDTYHLRNYAGTRSADEQITYHDALKEVIPEGHIFFFADGAWHLMSVPYISEQQGDSVTRFKYTWNGTIYTKDSSSTVSLRKSLSGNENYLLTRQSKSKHYSAYKRLRQSFNHKTLISSLSFDPSYVHSAVGDSPATESMEFESDGSQRITMSGKVLVKTDDTGGNFKTGDAKLLLQANDREYDLQNDSWPTSGSAIDINIAGTSETLTATFEFTTATIPSDADGDLTVELRWASDDGNNTSWNTQEVEWRNVALDIINGDQASDNAAIDYTLEQSQQYSKELSLPDRIYGKGPTSYSRSAIKHEDTNYQQVTSWSHKGVSETLEYAEITLGDMMDSQRDGTRVVDGVLWSEYMVGDVIEYDSSYFLFLGGALTGKTQQWGQCYLYELDHNSGSDTLSTIYDTRSQPSAGSGGTSSGTDGGGLSESDAKALFLDEANNLSDLDNASTARTNLGVEIDTDVQAWDTDLDTYSTNPLTATELGELQNIDSSTFTTSGWDNLSDISALSHTDSNFIVSDGTDWVVESGSTVQSSLGLKDQTADLDLNTLAINGDDLFDLFYRQDEIDSFFGLYYSKRDLESGNEDLHFNTLKLTNLTNDRVAIVGSNGLLEDDSQLTFDGTTFESAVQMSNDIDNFVSGFTGANWAIRDTGSNNWQMDIDDVYVRGALFANEFIINQILALNGSDILSPGRGKIESVSGSPSTETVTVSDPQGNDVASFVADDIVLVQTVRPDNNNIVKRLVRKVGSVSGNDVTFAALGDAPADTGSFEEGDVVVVIGNTSDTSRQSSIYRTAVDSDNPYTIIQDGVDSWTAWKSASKTKMKYGNLNGSYGYASDTFGIAAGSPNSDHVTIDPSNGFRLIDGADSNKVLGQFSSQIITFGDTSETNDYVKFDNSSGTVTADIDISTFRLNTPNLDINSATPRIDVGSSHFLDGSTDKASFAGGILVAKPSEVDLSTFTANSDYLTDNNTYIGNNLDSLVGGQDRTLIGNFNDGSLPYVRVRGGDGSNGKNKVDLFARPSTQPDSHFFRITTDGDNVVNVTSNEAKFFGAFADNTDLWGYKSGYAGDTSDKSNASVRLDFANGQIFYDAMGQLLYARTLEADFTEDAATGLMNSSWTSTVTSPGDGTEKSGSPSSKVLTTTEHKFGISTVRIKGKARVRNENGGGGSTECRVRIVYGNADSGYTTVTTSSESTSSFENFSIELDVSGETADTEVDLEVFVRARVSGDNSATKRHADMREDIKIMSFT